MKTQWAVTIASAMAAAMLLGCGANDDTSQENGDEPASVTGGLSPATPAVLDEVPQPDPGTPEIGSGARDLGSDTRPVEPVEPADAGPMPDEPVVPAESEPPVEPETPVEPAGDLIKADVGVGQAGRSLDEYEGVIVTPAKALFTVREKAVFQIQIPKAMQLHKALNGSDPKTHEEFMSKIIDGNSIQLPELPPGDSYFYDPQEGELMVRKRR